MIDTIRLILFLECNMRCSYCCNEQEKFSSKFVKKRFDEIDFDKYKNICITGGEPFLYPDKLFHVLFKLPWFKPIYIYTNGLRISNEHLQALEYHPIRSFNIGLHTKGQLKAVNPNIEKYFNVRFMVQDKFYDEMLQLYPERLNKDNLKVWKLNECEMPNEDWVLLQD